MKTSTNPLERYGYCLGSRIDPPENFIPSYVWTTQKYSFQLDTNLNIGRRTSADANPTIYFSLVQLQKNKTRRTIPARQIKKVLAGIGVSATILMLYPLYPAAQYQVQKQVVQTISHSTALAAAPAIVSAQNRVVIPKIGVETNILEGTSLAVLNKQDGVWHETGTEADNLVLAGHRFKYLPPNTTTLYNLDKVSIGDTIVVDWYHKRYIYVVSETKTVTKYDINIRQPTATPTLTIYSCEEKNQAHRIVVTAKRLD